MAQGPLAANKIPWWSTFLTTLFITRLVHICLFLTIIFGWINIGKLTYYFAVYHESWLHTTPDEQWAMSLKNDGIQYGLEVLKYLALIFGGSILDRIWMWFSVPSFLYKYWAQDSYINDTTGRWILYYIKWNRRLSLKNLIEAYKKGDQEAKGLKLMDRNDAINNMRRRFGEPL